MMRASRLWQFYASFASGFGCLVFAIISVWSSYTSPLYRSISKTPLAAPITKLEDSLLSSVPALGSMVGTAIAGKVLDKYGRRNGGILLSIPFVISWAIIDVSSSINMILAARFLGGISGGGAMVFGPIVVSEVSEDSIRGFLASVSMFQYCLGTFLSYVMGLYLSYRSVIWINIALSIVSISLLILMEETPAFLVKKKKYKESRLSIAKYRDLPASSIIVTEELTRLREQIEPPTNSQSLNETTHKAEEVEKLNNRDIQPNNNPEDNNLSSLKLLFSSLSSRRAFFVVNVLMTLMFRYTMNGMNSSNIFMGMIPIQVYANIVFTETDPTRSELYTVIFAVVQFVATIITSVITDKYGRRPLQIGSSVIVSLCLAGLGYTLQYDVVPSEVPVVLFMMYSFFYMVGVGSVPYILVAEVFAPEVLNCASMLVIEWMWLISFVIIAMFPYVTELIGVYGTFYGFCIVSCANAIISYFILPETAGLSNEDIQLAFLGAEKRGHRI